VRILGEAEEKKIV